MKLEKAKKFYTELFGWKLEKTPGTEYWMITTQEGTYCGMMKRFNPNQRITDYFGVFLSWVFRQSGEVGVVRFSYPRWPFPRWGTSPYSWIQRSMSLASWRTILKLINKASMIILGIHFARGELWASNPQLRYMRQVALPPLLLIDVVVDIHSLLPYITRSSSRISWLPAYNRAV